MQPLIKQATQLRDEIETAYGQLAIDAKIEAAGKLEMELSAPEVWNNPTAAQEKSKKLAALNAMIEPWHMLRAQLGDIVELMAMGDDSLSAEFTTQLDAFTSEFRERKKELLFNVQ